MLRDDAIYNLSFRFRNINLSNINDIYFAINIIIIATTLLKALIVFFVFEFIIVIILNVDIIVVIVIIIFVIVFERPVLKLIAFDLNIKNYLIINASLDKP